MSSAMSGVRRPWSLRALSNGAGARVSADKQAGVGGKSEEGSAEGEQASTSGTELGGVGSQRREEASESAPGSETLGAKRYSRVLAADREKKAKLDRFVRVDHAGELGAAQIYAGQLAVFGGTEVGKIIEEMKDQEQKHLDKFESLVIERRVRPTVMMPVWNVAGYALGLGTALMGKEAAMACTVAVEEVISDHYNDQVRQLLEPGFEDEGELRATFREFRDDELEHKHIGLDHDAELAPMYRVLSETIKAGCRAAIFVTERV